MTIGINLCALCSRNYYESELIDGVPTGTCEAFPEGIPLEIFAGGFDHREKFGEEDLLFELAPDSTEEQVARAIEFAAETGDE